ncbi:MAG TPA: sugar-transfer associated ATP-grasp domain-containing protein [Steroidobacteraceae bacterium]|nr:sugar-transfer associated ATP-grasp domain-containing protein [Steroidobacteraceae bacterium]
MAGYNWFYYFKKAYALYPGVVTPVCAPVLASHYSRRRAGRGPLRVALDACVGLGFHAWIPWRARRVQKHFGHDDAWRRRTAALAHAAFADPNDIALFRIDSAAALRSYIRRYEDAALNKQINPVGWTVECALADKRRFAARCRAAGLPHPATIATWSAGQLQILEDPGDRELVAKPADGEGGAGFCRLGLIADAPMLQARLSALRRVRGVLLVQPLVVVHEALRDLALAALPTVRIVTMVDEVGAPEVVSATFRCPTDPASPVDNMKAGGLIAPVALDSGRLGLGCLGYGGGDHAYHPRTAAPVLDRQLPDWQAARQLAMRAHAGAFADYVVVGWDVALSTSGPILIEGNGKPGVLMPQRAARTGLAQGRYGALLAYHLERVYSR